MFTFRLLYIFLFVHTSICISNLILFNTYTQAKCLDNSPSGFYVKNGIGNNITKMIWWFEGGGWCFNLNDCVIRANTRLGSSITWTPTASFEGILNENSTVNPDFASWTTVYWKYCDGSSFTSSVTLPVPYNTTFSLRFAGKNILDAGIDYLKKNFGLSTVTDIIVSGSSAGGLSTYLHVDYISSLLPSTNVVGMPDAGFFPTVPAIDGSYQWTNNFISMINLFNISTPDQINAACFNSMSSELRWMCLSAPNFYARIKSPLFMLQSVVDWAQLSSWGGLPTNCLDNPTSNCTSAQFNIIKGWTTVIQGQINASASLSTRGYPIQQVNSFSSSSSSSYKFTNSYAPPTTNGGFLAACIQHEQGYNDRRWNGDIINGRLMRDSFADWFFTRNGTNFNYWKYDVPWPNNTSCQPPGP
jgi:O-palmitoleoyl-L-serine hydrolase